MSCRYRIIGLLVLWKQPSKCTQALQSIGSTTASTMADMCILCIHSNQDDVLSAGQPELYHHSPAPMRQDTSFASQASASPAQALQQQSSWGASPLGNHGSIWSSTPSERYTSKHGPEGVVHLVASQ